jgi:alpha,alpha-trehalase
MIPERDALLPPDVSSPEYERWLDLNIVIGNWWDTDARRATEAEVSADPEGRLLFLPWSYVTPGGGEGTFEAMFNWDSYFINRGLLAHGRLRLVHDHIRNYLFMIERYGFMPNASVKDVLTRSQTPVFPDSIWRHYVASGDLDLVSRAYPLLKQEYEQYWNAAHHQTPLGLATNRDLGDQFWPPQFGAEAETGLDWTPIYGGDVRRCVPLITNCALVRYAQVLGLLADAVGCAGEAIDFAERATERADLIRAYCWNDGAGFFVEYDYVAGEQLPYLSDCTLWPLWAGVATHDQASRIVENLHVLEQRYGIACTDQPYPDPHIDTASLEPSPDPSVPVEMVGGRAQLQWMYPAGWAPMQIIAVEGLDAYGHFDAARRIASKFLRLVLDQYQATGKLWEKYNVVDGSLVLPNSRYGNVPMRGWTAAAAAVLGQRVFFDQVFLGPGQA